MYVYSRFLLMSFAVVFLSSCQKINFAELLQRPAEFVKLQSNSDASAGSSTLGLADGVSKELSISNVLSTTDQTLGFNGDFVSTIKLGVESHPEIIAAQRRLLVTGAKIEGFKGRKDFQVDATVYGGVEDVTDRRTGLAVVLRANKLLYDGGGIDSAISAEQLAAEAEIAALRTKYGEIAFELANVWFDLERYLVLSKMIDERLQVLDPLIKQLEQVAKAGIGDVRQVATAQRLVSAVRVTQTEVKENLERARLNFKNAFGNVPDDIDFEDAFLESLVPSTITDEMIHGAPSLLAKHYSLLALAQNEMTIRARDEFNVAFELRTSRPFGGSDFDSDESVGIVAKKTIYDGKILDSEVKKVLAELDVAKSELQATFREIRQTVQSSQQTVYSMGKAIELGKQNAIITAEEITYLRRQFVTGGSTLDSVLSAEARLYEVESGVVNFVADKRKAQLLITARLGLLAPALNLYKNTRSIK